MAESESYFYKGNGRTLITQFTCSRCGHIEQEEASIQDLLKFFTVAAYKHPPEWIEYNGHDSETVLLCPECAKKYKEFMMAPGRLK